MNTLKSNLMRSSYGWTKKSSPIGEQIPADSAVDLSSVKNLSAIL
ncbi:hypothetical protein [Ferruginibacter lapsinanis]|nr:hypothetical protein [Ferruginibacter lapsinanis]